MRVDHISVVCLAEIRTWSLKESPGTRAIVAEMATEIEVLREEKRKVLHGVLANPEVYGQHGDVPVQACKDAAEEIDTLRMERDELLRRLENDGRDAVPTPVRRFGPRGRQVR